MSEFSSNAKYDVEERTAKFAENVIDFVRTIKQDFIHKIGIVKKEIKETKHWR